MSTPKINIKATSVGKIFRGPQGKVTALEDVSFEVGAGEALGIIGRNGAGKSTLLKILAGHLKPTSGSIGYNGSISAILDLGWGFHPHLSGLDNILLSAELARIPAATARRKVDAILDFSELSGDVLHRHVHTYSSGMYLRLAFATALAWPGSILIFDEVMTVGDAGFVMKCARKLMDLKAAGHSIILVSHNMEQVHHYCDTALLLSGGRPLFLGPPAEAISRYHRFFDPYAGSLQQAVPPGFRLDGASFRSVPAAEGYAASDALAIDLRLQVLQEAGVRRDLAVIVNDFQGRQLFGDDTFDWPAEQLHGDLHLEWQLPPDVLNEGNYNLYLFWVVDNRLISCSNALAFRIGPAKPKRMAGELYQPFYFRGAFRPAAPPRLPV